MESSEDWIDTHDVGFSAASFVTAFFAVVMGFALIWHVWWMVAVGLFGAYATFGVFTWRDKVENIIPCAEVAWIDSANRSARTLALAENPT